MILIGFFLISTQIGFAQKAKLHKTISLNGYAPVSATFTPDGESILVSADHGFIFKDKRMFTIDVNTATIKKSVIPDIFPEEMSYSPDGKYLGLIASNGRLIIKNAETGRIISRSNKKNVIDFTFVGQHNEVVVSQKRPNNLMVYDVHNQSTVYRFGNISLWDFADVSNDGKKLITGDMFDLYGFDYASKETKLFQFRKPDDDKQFWDKVEIAPDNSFFTALIGVNSKYPSIEIYDMLNEELLYKQQVFNDKMKKGDINFSISPNGDYLLVSHHRDEILKLWDISSIYAHTENHKKILAKAKEQENEKEDNNQQMVSIMSRLDELNSKMTIDDQKKKQEERIICKEVDLNIPEVADKNPFRFALVIGNEDYSSYQTGLDSEVNVDYAIHDAKIFKLYLEKTMGIPFDNITYLENATGSQMKQALSKLSKLIEISQGNAEIFVYYSGHGLPDEKTKESYIMPVDVSGYNLEYAIKLEEMYAQLTKFPSKRITVFLDACFSGGGRNEGLVAVKGVKISPKDNYLKGNLVVFSSSSGKESSQVYRQKYHGMFSYYLMKKLKESKGNISYQNLADYLQENVKMKSVLINNKVQTPTTNVSQQVKNNWSDWMFTNDPRN